MSSLNEIQHTLKMCGMWELEATTLDYLSRRHQEKFKGYAVLFIDNEVPMKTEYLVDYIA